MFDYTIPPSAYEYVVEERPLHMVAKDHLAKYSAEDLDENWHLNDFFNTIYVINLPQATERLEDITRELESIGTTTFHRFEAVDGPTEVPPSIWEKFYVNRCNIDLSDEIGQRLFNRVRQKEAGCYLSHLGVIDKVKVSFEKALKNLREAEETHNSNAIRDAKSQVERYSRALILEDDARFGFLQEGRVTKKNVGMLFNTALAELPADWDILYFFVYPTEPTIRITDNLNKIQGSWYLMAYAIHYPIYADLVKTLNKIHNPEATKIGTVDLEIGAFQRSRNAYAITPHVAYHAGGASMITEEIFEPFQGDSTYTQENITGIPKPGYPVTIKTQSPL